MKICVFSDSHGETSVMLRAIEEHSPDLVIHLGDGERDAAKIQSRFPKLPVKAVRGNCDWSSQLPETERLELNGARLLLTHGHLYNVKRGSGAYVSAAQAEGVDLALYGHTHVPSYVRLGSLHVLNPGSCGSYSGGTFALVDISPDGAVSCRIARL